LFFSSSDLYNKNLQHQHQTSVLSDLVDRVFFFSLFCLLLVLFQLLFISCAR
jgi:hypothetical protein